MYAISKSCLFFRNHTTIRANSLDLVGLILVVISAWKWVRLNLELSSGRNPSKEAETRLPTRSEPALWAVPRGGV